MHLRAKSGLATTVITTIVLAILLAATLAYFVTQQNGTVKTTETVKATQTVTTTETSLTQVTQYASTSVVGQTTLTQTATTIVTVITTITSTTSPTPTVALSSATLYHGVSATSGTAATASIALTLNNPGSATYISALTMTGASIGTITAWDNSTAASSLGNLVVFSSSHPGNNAIAPSFATSFTYYPVNVSFQSITVGQLFTYIINFANGQSISGSLIAQ